MSRISDTNNISELFSILHDGRIVSCHMNNKDVMLGVEIRYLAQRIQPEYTKFSLLLRNARDFIFNTWPGKLGAIASTLSDPCKIFLYPLDILSSELKSEQVHITFNQSSPECDYIGGELSFEADSAEVIDEGGKRYTLDELGSVCESYWSEWKRKHKEKL